MSAPRSAVTRREMVGTVARWTVPTVVTMTLGARVLEAKASCPPCQKKAGPVCRACTVSQMLNCQCEPCLGPPYCAAVGPSSGFQPGLSAAPGSQSPSSVRTPGQNGNATTPGFPSSLDRQKGTASRDPFRQGFYPDPFGANRNPNNAPGLYQRLRPDSSRRLP